METPCHAICGQVFYLSMQVPEKAINAESFNRVPSDLLNTIHYTWELLYQLHLRQLEFFMPIKLQLAKFLFTIATGALGAKLHNYYVLFPSFSGSVPVNMPPAHHGHSCCNLCDVHAFKTNEVRFWKLFYLTFSCHGTCGKLAAFTSFHFFDI